VVYDRNLRATSQAFLQAVAPFRDGLIVAVECLFCWYWLADLCAKEQIAFVLGHALYMKAIRGGKAKNDQIDAGKIARLLLFRERPNSPAAAGCEPLNREKPNCRRSQVQ
jgi:transposase